MNCILLVAGHASRLEEEIRADPTGDLAPLVGVPKALLPIRGDDTVLDLWYREVRREFQAVYIVTNAAKFKYFERWATAHDFPLSCLINDGTTAAAGALGAVRAVELVVRIRHLEGPLAVIAGDMAFSEGFDLSGVVQHFQTRDGDLAVYYEVKSEGEKARRAMVDLDPLTSRLTCVVEKPPDPRACPSPHACPVFYLLRPSSVAELRPFLARPAPAPYSCGAFLAWLVERQPVYGMKLPVAFTLIGAEVSLAEYLRQRSALNAAPAPPLACSHRAYARVGLMGNPSDGFFGKTLAFTIGNFWAEATIHASEKLRIVPHPLHDPMTFGSLGDLHRISQKEGYMGGLRLLQATCKRFFQLCLQRGIALSRQNFTLSYDTNIPRQVGLAGSSAIVTAATRCLMGFYHLDHTDLPLATLPNFILSVENEELHIAGGLQDRVAQVYEGLLYMDFDRNLLETRGYGNYERMDLSLLPPLWLAFCRDPSDSGGIHSDVRERWRRGDEEVVQGMLNLAALAEEAKGALEARDYRRLAALMDRNFDQRRALFGDACLGTSNLEMVGLAREHGAAAKFPGSGGAVVGLCPEGAQQYEKVREALEGAGYVVVPLLPRAPP